MPLAPIADVDRLRLPDIIRRIDERLDTEAPPADASQLWTATRLLLGLRYDTEEAQQLLQGITKMRESSTYQAILAEGREEERAAGLRRLRGLLVDLAADRFGPADLATLSQIEQIGDVDTLNRLIRSVLHVGGWQELRELASRG